MVKFTKIQFQILNIRRSSGRSWIQIQGVEMVGLGVEMGGFSDQGVGTGRFRYMYGESEWLFNKVQMDTYPTCNVFN